MTDEKAALDWRTVADETAYAFRLPVEELTRAVQRELIGHLAQDIARAVIDSRKDASHTW